jgi:hypothetical protein
MARQGLFSHLVPDPDPKKPQTRVWDTEDVFFVGALPSDFRSSNCGILNGVQIRIELTLSDTDFFLMSDYAGATFQINDIELLVPCAVLTDALALKIQNRLKKEASLIQFRRGQVLPFNIPSNASSFISDCKLSKNLLPQVVWQISHFPALFPSTSLPCRVVIAFTSEKSFRGDLKLSPFNFRKKFGDCEITQVSLSLNGYEIDGLTDRNAGLDYYRLSSFCGMTHGGITNGISMYEFNDGYFFQVFDLTTSLSCASSFQNPVTRSGQTR